MVDCDVLHVDARRFIPFREGNILLKCKADFHLDDPSLRIDAASAFYPLMAGVTQTVLEPSAFSEQKWLRRVATGEGFESLAAGETDALVTTDGNELQHEMLERTGEEFVYDPIWTEPLAIIVNHASWVQDLSRDEIRRIYFEPVGEWNTYQLERGNGSQSAFEHLVKGNVMDSRHQEVHTMPGIIDMVASDKNGLCYAFWSYYARMYANKKTRMISVDGLRPENEKYPLRYPVYMIYRKNNPSGSLRSLVSWLKSPEGQHILSLCSKPERQVL